MMRTGILLLLVFAVFSTGASAGTQITFLDVMENSNTEFQVYNASGASVVNLTSNGSTYTFPAGSYVLQVLPANPGYAADPLQIIYVLLAGVGVVFGLIFIFSLLIGWGRIVKIISEVRI